MNKRTGPKKRQINEELADIWSIMIDEHIEKMRSKNSETSKERQRDVENYIDGMIAAVTMLNCLEKGRFVNDYERIRKTLKKEE